MKRFYTTLIFSAMLPILSFAQTTHNHHDHDEASFPHFRAAVLMGHTSTLSGADANIVFIPSWGLDFEYWFNHKIGIGSHNDLEVETFIVEIEHEQFIERAYPLVSTIEVLYKPWKDFVVQFGPGVELEKEKNYSVVRFGLEYEFEFGNHWDLSPTIFYDSRFGSFDTWTFAVGVGKRF